MTRNLTFVVKKKNFAYLTDDELVTDLNLSLDMDYSITI